MENVRIRPEIPITDNHHLLTTHSVIVQTNNSTEQWVLVLQQLLEVVAPLGIGCTHTEALVIV